MVDIKVENLSFTYPGGKKALKDINFEIQSGRFVVLCGESASGKTTLLRMLKKELSPLGKTEGNVFLFEKERKDLTLRESAEKIGFLLQNPEFQLVTHSVQSEIAFGLENLGLESGEIHLRLAEIASYFSLSNIMDKKISELSGGQKQLVCLAAVAAMHPSVLILDEPTSRLDPMTSELFVETVFRLCRENGITVIISEHRLENLIAKADRVIVLEDGKIICDKPPQKISKEIFSKSEFVKASMPVSMRLHAALKLDGDAPLTVSQGRLMLSKLFFDKKPTKQLNLKEEVNQNESAVKMRNVAFAYDKSGYVLKSLNLDVKKGSFFAILGENAVGKSTVMKLMCGLIECKKGTIELFGKNIKKYSSTELYRYTTAYLSQNCENLFAGPTIREDFENLLKSEKLSSQERNERISFVSEFFEIKNLLSSHPYDVSGGELQRAAIAMTMLRPLKLLLLDEPTKAMDNLFKKQFAQKIRELCESGVTVVIVSHDIEFCAKYCDECALIFDGVCSVQKSVHKFFSNNFFYTTAANKISRHIFNGAITESEVLALCRDNQPKQKL